MSATAYWSCYMDILRTKVIPLIDVLKAKRIINWYSFLVHDRESGVPTTAKDKMPYVHLRFELAAEQELDDLKKKLPDYCVMTRRMPPPGDMSGVDFSRIEQSDLALGWKILGESSEWVLEMVRAQKRGKKVSIQNVNQFLHYIGNQTQGVVVGIRMP